MGPSIITLPFLLRRASDFSKYTDVDARPYSVPSTESKHRLTRYYCLRILISSVTKIFEKIVSKPFSVQFLQPFFERSLLDPFREQVGLVDRLRALGLSRTLEAKVYLMFAKLGEEMYHGSFVPTARMVEVFSVKVQEWP